jgi:hypothetical protein
MEYIPLYSIKSQTPAWAAGKARIAGSSAAMTIYGGLPITADLDRDALV